MQSHMHGLSKRSALLRLANYLAPYRVSVFIAFIGLVVIVATTMSLGAAMKDLIDLGISACDNAALNAAIIRIMLLVLGLGVGSFIRSYCVNSVSEKVASDIRSAAYHHALKLKYHVFERITVGDMVSRLSTDIDLISRLIVDAFSYIIRNGIISVCGLVLMFMESVKLSLLVLSVVPFTAVLLIIFGKKVRVLSRLTQSEFALFVEYMRETFSSIQTIYSLNAQPHKHQQFDKHVTKFLDISNKRLRFRARFFAFAIMIIMCSIVFVIWVGAQDVLERKITSGNLISFIFYASYSALSFGGITEIITEIQRYIVSLERVFEIIDIPDIETTSERSTNIAMQHPRAKDEASEIEFLRVSFCYPSRPDVNVISDMSFNIKKGEKVVIIGRSGSGKSTIAQLLLGFFDISCGSIRVLGEDLYKIDSSFLRQKILYVPQNPFIFSGTIKDNLRYQDHFSEKDIEFASNVSGLDDVAKELPQGMDTNIGMFGLQLSGGQRQRIAIARAVLSKSDILLLDEATNALDQKSEKVLLNKLQNAMSGKTMISITHRISIARLASRILVVNDGRIISHGTHDYLMDTCMEYRVLCNIRSE